MGNNTEVFPLRQSPSGRQRAQDLRPVLQDGNRVLEMGGPPSISRNDSPSILKDTDGVGSLVDHGLQAEDHSFLETGSLVGRSVIGNLRLFVKVFAYPVADEVPYDGKAVSLDPGLDRMGDGEEAIADAGHFNPD